MPSPVGHEMAGLIVYNLLRRPLGSKQKVKVVLFCLSVAIVPDFDFIPGLLEGVPNKYHHGLSHSVLVGFLVSITIGAVFFYNQKPWVFITLFFSIYLSHILLDLFSLDQSYPYGLKLFWPFSNEYFISPRILFSDIRRANSSMEFLTSLILNEHNYKAVLRELIVLTPPVILLKFYNKWRISHE